MKTFFYFNDCLPYGKNESDYINALDNTLHAYRSLDRKFDREIIMEKRAGEIELANGFTLLNCIGKLGREQRIYAFSVLNKYPIGIIEEYAKDQGKDIDRINEEAIMQNYFVSIDKERKDAINLALAALWEAVLFTMGVNEELRSDRLQIIGASSSIEADNLYGEENNTAYINGRLNAFLYQTLSLWDKIEYLVGGRLEVEDDVRDSIDVMEDNFKKAVINLIEEAKKQNKLRPVKADLSIISPVYSKRRKDKLKSQVYELRVRKPVELRIYFTETHDGLHFLYLGSKAGNQNKDVQAAYDRIHL